MVLSWTGVGSANGGVAVRLALGGNHDEADARNHRSLVDRGRGDLCRQRTERAGGPRAQHLVDLWRVPAAHVGCRSLAEGFPSSRGVSRIETVIAIFSAGVTFGSAGGSFA